MHDQDRSPQEACQPKVQTGPPDDLSAEAVSFAGVLGELKETLDRLQDQLAQSDISQRMARELEQVGSAVRGFQAAHTDLATEMQRLKADEKVVTGLHERCRALSERFYQREVLRPTLLRLISIADRCREDEAQIKSWFEDRNTDSKPAVHRVFRCLLRARTFDRLEIESALGDLDVVPFQRQAEDFSPHNQKALARVATSQQSLHGQIAGRIRPGYQRGDEIIRPEWVYVYAAGPAAPTLSGDEQ